MLLLAKPLYLVAQSLDGPGRRSSSWPIGKTQRPGRTVTRSCLQAMALLLPLLVIVAVLLLVLAAASTLRFGTWRKKGVPYLTPLPIFGNSVRAFLQREPIFLMLDRIYRQFPGQPYVGVYAGPSPVLLVKSVEAVKQMTIKDFHVFPNHKLSPDPHYDRMFSKFLFCMLDGEWKDMRVRMSPSFSTGRLKTMFPSIRDKGEQLVECIRSNVDKEGVFVTNAACTRYGVDVIATCAFGIEAGSLRMGEPSPYMQAVAQTFRYEAAEGLSTFALMFVPALYHALRLPLIKEWRSALLMGLLRESSQHREKQPPANRDIFDNLLSLKRNGDVSEYLFEAQVMTMQVAGSETTAKTIMMALWNLARHPDVQDKLRAELRAAASKDGGSITYESLHDLKYLDMVFRETLRLWPVMPWLDRVATQDYVLPDSDIKIEKGTLIMVPLYSIQRDPEHYANPNKFDPERWAPENAANLNKLAYLPFGSGPRICIGSRFADMNVKSALLSTILNFRVSPCAATPRSEAELRVCPRSFLVTVLNDIPLRFEPL